MPARRLVRLRTATGLVAVAAVAAVIALAAIHGTPSRSSLTVEPVGPPGVRPAATSEQPIPEVDRASEPGAAGTTSEEDGTELDVPRPVPARVLAVRFLGGPGLAVVDLERGRRVTRPRGAHGMPGDAVGGAGLLADGTVVVWQDATVRAYVDGLDDPPLAHTPAELINPAGAAPSLRVLPTVDEHALWVVQIGVGCCPEPVPGRAELVDLATGDGLMTVRLPPHSLPVAATTHGLLLNTHRFVETPGGWLAEPGSHRTLLLGRGGAVTEVSRGEAIAAGGHAAAVRTCEDHDRRRGCELALVDLVTGDERHVTAPAGGTWESVTVPRVPTDTPPWNASDPDGRLLVGLATPTRTRLVAVEPGGGADVLLEVESPHPTASWDRQGERIVLAVGSDVSVHDPAEGTSFTVRDAIPPDHYVLAMG